MTSQYTVCTEKGHKGQVNKPTSAGLWAGLNFPISPLITAVWFTVKVPTVNMVTKSCNNVKQVCGGVRGCRKLSPGSAAPLGAFLWVYLFTRLAVWTTTSLFWFTLMLFFGSSWKVFSVKKNPQCTTCPANKQQSDTVGN